MCEAVVAKCVIHLASSQKLYDNAVVIDNGPGPERPTQNLVETTKAAYEAES